MPLQQLLEGATIESADLGTADCPDGEGGFRSVEASYEIGGIERTDNLLAPICGVGAKLERAADQVAADRRSASRERQCLSRGEPPTPADPMEFGEPPIVEGAAQRPVADGAIGAGMVRHNGCIMVADGAAASYFPVV